MRITPARKWLGLSLCAVVSLGLLASSPTQSVPLAAGSAPDGKAPPAGPGQAPAPSAALAERRDELKQLEAECAETQAEMWRHLADVADAPAAETRKAEAAYQRAKLDREVAALKIVEYEQGQYLQELESLRGEIALAQSQLTRTIDRMAFVERLGKLGKATRGDLVSAHLGIERATFAKEQAETKLRVLERFTKGRELNKLRSVVQALTEAEGSARKNWEAAQAVEKTWRDRVALVKSAISERHVLALLDEAGAHQAKVITLLKDAAARKTADGATPEKARADAEAVRALIADARGQEEEARRKMVTALDLSQTVQAWRDELRATEAKLRVARERLRAAESTVIGSR